MGVLACDAEPINVVVTQLRLGHDRLPGDHFNLVLLCYVLMFLDPKEQKQLVKEVNRVTELDAFLVIELFNAKDSYPAEINDVIEPYLNAGWVTYRKSKDRAILRKII